MTDLYQTIYFALLKCLVPISCWSPTPMYIHCLKFYFSPLKHPWKLLHVVTTIRCAGLWWSDFFTGTSAQHKILSTRYHPQLSRHGSGYHNNLLKISSTFQVNTQIWKHRMSNQGFTCWLTVKSCVPSLGNKTGRMIMSKLVVSSPHFVILAWNEWLA